MHARKMDVDTLADTARMRDEMLRQALEDHAAGRLDEASILYRQLHDRHPGDSEVLMLMGVLCCDLGLFGEARRFLDQALAIAPVFPEARKQLAAALIGLAEAAITDKNLTLARRHFDDALRAAPGDPDCLTGLGRLALLEGDSAAAEARLVESLTRRPMHVQTLNWLGLARLNLGKAGAAENCLRQALYLQPELNQARNNLGLALYQQERFEEARKCFEAALTQDPAYAKARINLGVTLRVQGEFDRARRELETVLAADPDEIDALNDLGIVFQDTGQAELALKVLSQANRLAPESAPIRWNLSLTQLLLGNFAQGWVNYEARWQGCEHLRGGYALPPGSAWRGEPLTGKRLLLWAEQGLGDTIQFIRFAKDVAARGAEVSVLAPAPLAELLRGAPGVTHVHDGGIPAFDLHCPLMSLPLWLGTSMDAQSLHGAAPYLFANPGHVRYWGGRIEGHAGLKVGIVWAGNARDQSRELKAIDLRRSIALERLRPLLAAPGCTFYSLQKGPAALELTNPELCGREPLEGVSIHDFSAEWLDFSDTAAFVANLDLVVSVDTAVAHLAGALGKPVWLLNRYDTCWRWSTGRDDSPWYATLRQFRQPRLGDWDSVIAAAVAALREWTRATAPDGRAKSAP